MHELALAEAIVAIAERHADGRRVARVDLAVGRLRQVVVDALAFSFELVAQGTPVQGAEFHVEDVPIVIACDACGAETQVETFPLRCGHCGSLEVEVQTGEEFHVVALEFEDAAPAVDRAVGVVGQVVDQLLTETTKGGTR